MPDDLPNFDDQPGPEADEFAGLVGAMAVYVTATREPIEAHIARFRAWLAAMPPEERKVAAAEWASRRGGANAVAAMARLKRQAEGLATAIGDMHAELAAAVDRSADA